MSTRKELIDQMSELDRNVFNYFEGRLWAIDRYHFLKKAVEPLFVEKCACGGNVIYFTWVCPVHGSMTVDELEHIAQFQELEWYPPEEYVATSDLTERSKRTLDL